MGMEKSGSSFIIQIVWPEEQVALVPLKRVGTDVAGVDSETLLLVLPIHPWTCCPAFIMTGYLRLFVRKYAGASELPLVIHGLVHHK